MTRTRAAIITAALSAVGEVGWEATSMETVRSRAGISNGSLFHHFPTRRELQAAVIAAALREHQDMMREVLAGTRRADRAVREVVLRHFTWLASRQHVAHLLVTTPRSGLLDRLADEDVEQNRQFMADVARWLAGHGWPGSPSLPLLVTLWIGPANEYARGWLTSGEPPDPSAPGVLADAAWRALAPYLEDRT